MTISDRWKRKAATVVHQTHNQDDVRSNRADLVDLPPETRDERP